MGTAHAYQHGEATRLLEKLTMALDRARRPFCVPPRVHVDDALASERLSVAILDCLSGRAEPASAVTVVCIGTDRSTGDSLGPLVGSRLSRLNIPGVRVFGTLDEPVHAANLHQFLTRLREEASAPGHVVVAVDACLGRTESVGCVSVRPGPLRPGTGVNKDLPPVGDFHIMGVVNVGGFMEYFVLQNTRLSLVMRMAETIAEGLRLALEQWASVQEAAAAGAQRRPRTPATALR